MKFRKIKGTDLKSSVIGFGTWGLSGKVYGKITKNRSKKLLEYAIDNGINFFDTSSLYGDGSVEKILGETLKPYKNSKNLIVATKVGMIKNYKNYFVPKYNFSNRHIQTEIYKSMKRLKTDSLDILQLHSPKYSLITSKRFEDIINLLEKNQRTGNIKYYGISVQNPKDAQYLLEKNFNFKVIQLNYNMLDIRALDLDIFNLAIKKSVSIISRTPMAMGFLSKNVVDKTKFNNLKKRFDFTRFTQRKNAAIHFNREFKSKINLPNLALKFSLSHKAIVCTLPGMMNFKEVDISLNSIKSNFDINKKNLLKIQKIYKNYFD